MVTVAFALLFVVMVVGLTALSIREQRQSGDTDQSNRAFAGAEAGIKDALSMLDKEPRTTINDCADSRASKPLDTSGQYSITCMTITQSPGPIESQADKDESKSAYVFMSGQPAPDGGGGPTSWADKLEFFWSRKASGDSAPAAALSGTMYPSFDGSSPWIQPAAVELTFVYWKVSNPSNDTSIDVGSGSFDTNKSLMTKTYLIMPSAAGTTKDDGSPVHSPKIKSSCSTTLTGPPSKNEYYCKLMQGTNSYIDLQTVFGGTPRDYRFVFKFKPRYSKTSYYANFTAGGTPVKVPATSAVIDVTAKSGNLYKRLRAERSLETRARGTVFDSAVFSGTDICKNLSVDSANNTKSYNNCD